jgi:apolipoprotein N-acyltransferase
MSTTPAWNRRTRTAAALASATLVVLANPSWDLWWLSFVALVPWLLVVRNSTPRQAFWAGWLCGTVAVGWGFWWLYELLTRFGGVPPVVAPAIVLVFGAAQGLQFALPAAFAAWWSRRALPGALWTIPLAWATCEVLLPTIFPMNVAIVWALHPEWIQAAELGGVTAVSFLVLLVNALVTGLVEAAALRPRRALLRPATLAVAVTVAIPLLGRARMQAVDAALADLPTVPVGVVQGNMSIEQMLTPGWPLRILERHQETSAALERSGARLLLWGETAYPGWGFDRSETRDLPSHARGRVRRGFTVPLLFGLVTRDDAHDDPYPWNSAAVLHPDDRLGDRYDKVHLLMFGEYTPLVDPDWFREIFPRAAHLHRGDGPSVLRVDDWRFGPLICYEDVLTGYAAGVADLGIHAFVNFTNDAWFGASSEPVQHLALAIFRAVEHRRALVRAVNTGISAHVEPSGRLAERTPATDPTFDGTNHADGFVTLVRLVAPDLLRTPFGRFGPWGWLALAWLVPVALVIRRPR